VTSLLERVAARLERRTNPPPRAAVERFPTPGDLARFLRHDTVQTPMLDLIDAAIMAADSGEQTRWIINCPPQEGKSTRMQAAALWLLLRDPTRRVAFASYEQGLAQVSGLAIRQFIETHGGGISGSDDWDRDDVLDLALDPSRGAAGSWALAPADGLDNPGGVRSVGVGSGLTGRPVDVLIVDDPLKDAAQADSKKIRKNVKDWWESVAQTRILANAIVIVVQTRWHEDDLSGWLITEDDPTNPRWSVISVAAQALAPDPEQGIGEDPLGRAPGEWLESARGRTVADWEAKREAVGRGGRWWNALYQQRPAPPEGGVFKREWFKRDRIHELPPMRRITVMVDPADNTGTGDEAGLIVAGQAQDGRYVIIADYSAHYTVDGWFRRAYFALVEHEATSIRWESSLSGLHRSAKSTWKRIRHEARSLLDCWREVSNDPFPDEPVMAVVHEVARRLGNDEDTDEDTAVQRAQLLELWPWALGLRKLPPTGPAIDSVPAKGDKLQRAELVQPLYSNRQVSHLSFLSGLEHEMATWMVTQKSPNRMDALVHVLLFLSEGDGGASVVRNTETIARHQVGRPLSIPSSASVMRRR
jgi:hypothetical protein